MSNSWHKYFFKLTRLVATKSKDHSTQVGAVLVGPDKQVLSTGYNGFPRGIDDTITERYERPEKYLWTEHAERNAIFNAARSVLKGSTLYLMYTAPPCMECSRAVIQAGIARVVIPAASPWPGKGQQWNDEFMKARQMLNEAGVILEVSSEEPEQCQLFT